MIRRSQRLQEKTPTARLESQMLNETFNNIPEEKEISDKDTVKKTIILRYIIEKDTDAPVDL